MARKDVLKPISEKLKLEEAIKLYVESWFDGLKKSYQVPSNEQALKASYNFIAKQAVKVYLEENPKS